MLEPRLLHCIVIRTASPHGYVYGRMKIMNYSNGIVGVQTRRLGVLHEREGESVERHTGRRSLRLEAAAAAAQHSSVCEHRNVDCPPLPCVA